MCVGLVTHFAQIGLVRRVNVHVLLSVAAVCKPSVAALKLTLEWFLSWRMGKKGEIWSGILKFILGRLPGLEKRLCARQESVREIN